MKVEYHGALDASMDVVWIWYLLGELDFLVEEPTISYYDNKSAIQVSNNLLAHNKMKHVELHVHYLRQLVHEHIVSLLYCRTEDQAADIYAKSLSEAKFIKSQNLLTLHVAVIMGGVCKCNFTS